ncbi:MAG: SdrD B-like domain-containing protein [Actinomycetota bacterium]
MSEKVRLIVSVMLVVAIALLLAFPFVPAIASDAGASGKKASTSGSIVVEEKAAGAEKKAAAAEVEAAVREEAALVDEKVVPEEAAAVQAGFEAAGGSTEPEEPWEVTSLNISKDVDVVTESAPEISLEKTASESYIEMMLGAAEQVTFTIEVDAEFSNSYYIAGNIFVQNTGDWAADVIAVSDTVWYKAGGPNWLAATSNITTTVPMGDNAIPTGGPHVYSYSGTFTLPVPLASVTAMSNLIEITISNKPDPPKPGMQDWKFHYREDFAKPVAGGSTEVMLEDIETIEPASGLSYEITTVTINGSDAGSLTGPWALDLAEAPFTVVIEKDLTAEEAGTYILNNKAKIGDLEDDVDVEIVVEEPEKEYGSITGYKYEDVNISGELEEGESGWAGITIELWLGGVKIDETVTDSEGMFHFADLEAGDYEVKEVLPDGVANSGPLSIAVSLEEGEHVVLEEYFLNYHIPQRYAEIHGYKYVDLNADGILDEGEPGLAGVTIKLYRLESMDPVAVISIQLTSAVLVAETITDENGYFEFKDLVPGEYMVEEVVPEGYYPTSQNPISGWLAPGQGVEVYFLNARMARITGEKVDAITGEPIEGVQFVLEGGEFYAEAFSDENGLFDFGLLMPGEYHLYEVVPEGWVAVGASEHEITLESGDEEHLVFINQELLASVSGTKWLDLNANGAADEGEEGLAGVAINLRDAEGEIIATTLSAADGSYSFTGLKAGGYTVEEIVGDGYVATAPVSVSFELQAGDEKVVDFFNNVVVAGEVVNPPVQPEAQETLPVTGFEMSYLLIIVGLLILAGAFIASYGLLKMARTR